MSESRRNVVVAGAGVAGLETALALRALAGELVSVELVAPEHDFTYRPLAVAEPFGLGDVRRTPLASLVREAGAQLLVGALAAVDSERKIVTLEDGAECPYDMLVLALGARPREAVSGALTFRGPEDGAAFEALLDRARAGQLERIVFALPGAVAWPLPLYELASLTAAYLAAYGTSAVEVVLVTPEVRPLALFGPAASDAIAKLLETGGVRVESLTVAQRWEDGVLQLAGGAEMQADAVVAMPRLEGPPIGGLPQDENGFVATDEVGRVPGLGDVTRPATSRASRSNRAASPPSRGTPSPARLPPMRVPRFRRLPSGLSCAACCSRVLLRASSVPRKGLRSSKRTRSGGRPRRSSGVT